MSASLRGGENERSHLNHARTHAHTHEHPVVRRKRTTSFPNAGEKGVISPAPRRGEGNNPLLLTHTHTPYGETKKEIPLLGRKTASLLQGKGRNRSSLLCHGRRGIPQPRCFFPSMHWCIQCHTKKHMSSRSFFLFVFSVLFVALTSVKTFLMATFPCSLSKSCMTLGPLVFISYRYTFPCVVMEQDTADTLCSRPP